MRMDKLLAIDGLNIVRRVYEASPEPDSDLKASIALRHALSSFRNLLEAHAPTHVLAAFDYGGPTWRHALYPALPRRARADAARSCARRCPEFHERLREGRPARGVAFPSVEADDVIATGVLRWLAEGRGDAIVATTDKDLHCLIAHGALVWDHFKGEWHDDAWVRNKFGVAPERLHDLLALMGDADRRRAGRVEGRHEDGGAAAECLRRPGRRAWPAPASSRRRWASACAPNARSSRCRASWCN